MASHAFGHILRMTTWGESHGPAMGVVLDGCPAGLQLDPSAIQVALDERAPGRSPFTSPRREADQVRILSGMFEGYTTGAPLAMLIENVDADSKPYDRVAHVFKPGHAQATYQAKYGRVDYRGGGRASARETVCRVAAGAVARQILKQQHAVDILGLVQQVGPHAWPIQRLLEAPHDPWRQRRSQSQLGCPCPETEQAMVEHVKALQAQGDSCGGCVAFLVQGLVPGWGDPVYEKMEAKLASAMMSLPASKGFEMGYGFEAAGMLGSEHNDAFDPQGQGVGLSTYRAGGTLGGITTGTPLIGRVAFKPTSSIRHRQASMTTDRQSATFQLPTGSRHDPCVALRAVPVVEAMCALVLADAMLMHRSSQL